MSDIVKRAEELASALRREAAASEELGSRKGDSDIPIMREAAQAVIDMAGEIARLRAALDSILIGGNHLANALIGIIGGDFAKRYPPTMPPLNALEKIGAGAAFDMWGAWASIMKARAALQESRDGEET